MSIFVPGLALARAFYSQAVKPVIARHLPRLSYSAALIGSGSETLGYDDAVSTDHHWGPRLMLFLSAADHKRHAQELQALFADHLPYRFMGYPTNFSAPKSGEGDHGSQLLQATSQGKINHRVELLTLDGYLRDYLGMEADAAPGPADWLSLPQHKLLSFSAGAVFHDDIGLGRLRERYRYYPRDVWLYLLACGWQRIGQDEHLAPRAGSAGDELGSALIAARLVRSIMLLCFLYERRYAPYPKWLGRAFGELACGPELRPILRAAQAGETWRGREAQLCLAYHALNRLHNRSGIAETVQPAAQDFHGRGFKVSHAWRYVERLLAEINAPELRDIASRALIGGVDQFSDNTDLRETVELRGKIAGLYAP